MLGTSLHVLNLLADDGKGTWKSKTGHITEENVTSIFCASVPTVGEKVQANQPESERTGGASLKNYFHHPLVFQFVSF